MISLDCVTVFSFFICLQLKFELLLPTLNFAYLTPLAKKSHLILYRQFFNIKILYASLMNGLVFQKLRNTGNKALLRTRKCFANKYTVT